MVKPAIQDIFTFADIEFMDTLMTLPSLFPYESVEKSTIRLRCIYDRKFLCLSSPGDFDSYLSVNYLLLI